jgi:hypothetical protein
MNCDIKASPKFITHQIRSLTNSMEPSPSREAASRSDTQEFLNILRNMKVQYPAHKNNSTGLYPEPEESSPYHPTLFP